MKYICILILATAICCRGCTRSKYMLRSVDMIKGRHIGNAAISTAIDDVQKSFANARLSQKLNPFRSMRYHIGKSSSINAEVKVSKKQGGWKRQLLKSGEFDSIFKKCTPVATFRIPMDYWNYTQKTKNYWYYARAD